MGSVILNEVLPKLLVADVNRSLGKRGEQSC